MGGGGAGGAGIGHFGGGGFVRHHGGPAYSEDWMATTKKTLEAELKFRGIDPAIINEVVSKVEEPSVVGPVLIGILATALACTLIFVVIWESTP